MAVIKFPQAGTEGDARELLMRTRLLPYCPTELHASPLDPLLNRGTLRMLRRYHEPLTRVYAHYATFDVVVIGQTSWRECQRTGSSINSHEFVLFLINFGIIPYLLTKREALALFHSIEVLNDSDREVDKISYPPFVEFLLRAAELIGSRLCARLRAPGLTVAEQAALRRLLDCAPPPARAEFDVSEALPLRFLCINWFWIELIQSEP